MKFHNVRIVYFSGTGCTRLVAETFRNQLVETGHNTTIVEIHHDMTLGKSDYDLLVLCFPVYACNAPQIVITYVKGSQVVHHIPVALISVSAGGEMTPNLACRTSIKKELTRKGFAIHYEKMLVMPSNWVIATKPCLAALLVRILPKKIAYVISELDSGSCVLTRPGFGNRFLSLLGKMEIGGAKSFGKRIKVGTSCNGCGLCSKHCPTANISMQNATPVFGKKCILCLQCIYQCPNGSLVPGIGKFMVLQEGFDLQKIQATLPWKEPVDIDVEATGLLWFGVRRYLQDTHDI